MLTLRQDPVKASGPCVKRPSFHTPFGLFTMQASSGRDTIRAFGTVSAKGSVHGRPGLRRVDHRDLRGSRVDVAWFGAAVSGTGAVANIVAGVLALALLVYLFVALIRPEKF
ncbi:hypothetical protein GCM10029964_088770 [Kibdelosporangium lantanae]